MDIAVSVLTDVQDCTLELEPAGDGMLVIYCGMVPERFNRMSSGPDDVVRAVSNDAVWALRWVRQAHSTPSTSIIGCTLFPLSTERDNRDSECPRLSCQQS